MIAALTLIGWLSIIGGIVLAVIGSRLGGIFIASYIVAGLASSLIWFALARILSRQNELHELLLSQMQAVPFGSDTASDRVRTFQPSIDMVVLVSPKHYGAPDDLIRDRLLERRMILEQYADLVTALEAEWEHFLSVARPGESLHATVEAAKAHTQGADFKSYAYVVRRKAFREQLAYLLPSVRG